MHKKELDDLIDNGITLKSIQVSSNLAQSLRRIPVTTQTSTVLSRPVLLAIAATFLALLSVNIYVTRSVETVKSSLESYLDFNTMHL